MAIVHSSDHVPLDNNYGLASDDSSTWRVLYIRTNSEDCYTNNSYIVHIGTLLTLSTVLSTHVFMTFGSSIAIQSDYKTKVAVSSLCDIAVLKTVCSPKIARKLVTFFATSYTYCSLKMSRKSVTFFAYSYTVSVLVVFVVDSICFAFAATLGFSSNIDYYALATIPIHSDKGREQQRDPELKKFKHFNHVFHSNSFNSDRPGHKCSPPPLHQLPAS